MKKVPIKFAFPCRVCFYRPLTTVSLMGMFNYYIMPRLHSFCLHPETIIFFMTGKKYWDFKLTNVTTVLSYVYKVSLNPSK